MKNAFSVSLPEQVERFAPIARRLPGAQWIIPSGGWPSQWMDSRLWTARKLDAQGLSCAVALQRLFVQYSEEHPEQPLRLRIGLHTGQAIRDKDKFFGKTVIQAFRIADLAQGQEILVSQELCEASDGAPEYRFGEVREVSLKGIRGTKRIFSVDWQSP